LLAPTNGSGSGGGKCDGELARVGPNLAAACCVVLPLVRVDAQGHVRLAVAEPLRKAVSEAVRRIVEPG
jgi:hypothetical protein